MKTTEKNLETVVNEINNVYSKKGLNGVYAFLRKNGVNYKTKVEYFGLATNKEAAKDKIEWLKSGELRFHYANLQVKSAKTGWKYNRLRGIEIILL